MLVVSPSNGDYLPVNAIEPPFSGRIMRYRQSAFSAFLAFLGLIALPLPSKADESIPLIFESGSDTLPDKLIWATEPGVRYDLWESADLDDWTRVPGYPAAAEGLAMEYSFTPVATGFFRILPIDEQPPVVVAQYPADEGFAVGRFADIAIALEDATGIDPATVQLSVGGLGPFTVAAPELTYADGVLTFDSGGDTALGGWSETLTATLIVEDTLGNTLTHTWTFRLELEPQVVANITVFGSPAAQCSGQRVSGPAANLATRFPVPPDPQKADDPPAWSIDSVLADRIVIAYEPGGAPVFPPDSFLCNLTPANTDQIFYRRLLSISDDVPAGRLTLLTEDVALEELIQQGSANLSRDSVAYETDGNGTLTRAFELSSEVTFDTIGPDLSGEVLWSGGGATLLLDEARWQLTPTLTTSFEVSDFKLQRLDAKLRGAIRTALVPRFNYQGSASFSGTNPLADASCVVFLGVVGVPPLAIPIWLELDFSLAAEFSASASIDATMSGGVRQNFDFGFGGSYTRGESPAVVWTDTNTPQAPQIIPFSYSIDGTANAEIKLTPQIDVRVNSLAGVSANIDPRFGFTGNATVVDGELESADWTLYSRADLNLGMSVLGVDGGSLPSTSFPLYSSEWAVVYPEDLAIKTDPQSVVVAAGGLAKLEVVVVGSDDITYQWFHNGLAIPGQTDRQLFLPNVQVGKTGAYFVRVKSSKKNQTLDSDIAVVSLGFSLVPDDDFALIPAGSFQMGDTFGEGSLAELPVHSVFVSEFYMGKYEVTKKLWDDVRVWGQANGYTDLHTGGGKGAAHPVHTITWYSMVKWCNARSQKDGLTPCYTVGGAIYKTGYSAPMCNWGASGYRLPTEAEWEKAARGGLSGKRFPWGDTIDHSRANYRANGSAYSYDTSPYTSYTFHPTYDDGWTPYSSPVGSFASNGYGLYDMAGNMWESCWDWYSSGYYASSPGSDPHGSASGAGRVIRGGSWFTYAWYCRAADRYYSNPDYSNSNLGFRIARSSSP